MNFCDLSLPAAFIQDVLLQSVGSRRNVSIVLNTELLRPLETFLVDSSHVFEEQLKILQGSLGGVKSTIVTTSVAPGVELHQLVCEHQRPGSHGLFARMYLEPSRRPSGGVIASVLKIADGTSLKGLCRDVILNICICLSKNDLITLIEYAIQNKQISVGDYFCFNRNGVTPFQTCRHLCLDDMNKVAFRLPLTNGYHISGCILTHCDRAEPFLAEGILNVGQGCAWFKLEKSVQQNINSVSSSCLFPPVDGPETETKSVVTGDDICNFILTNKRVPKLGSGDPYEKKLMSELTKLITLHVKGGWVEDPLKFLYGVEGIPKDVLDYISKWIKRRMNKQREEEHPMMSV